MNDLFVYGSLMNPEVYRIFIQPKHKPVSAVLKGYQRFFVSGYEFPGIKTDENSEVNGLLLLGLTDEQINILDNFEADWYSREKVDVLLESNTTKSCEVYLFQKRYQHLLSDRIWDNQTFRKRYMDTFIKRFSAK